MPNRSLSSATTKFACSMPPGCRRPNEMIGRRSGSGLPRISIRGLAATRPARGGRGRARGGGSPRCRPGLLEREHEPGANRLDDRRRAALLADLRVRVVGVRGRADEQTVPPPGTDGTRLRSSARLATSTPGVPGPADELVRRDEHRVLVSEPRRAGSCRSAGTARRPRSPSTTARRAGAADRHPVDVGDDAGHVRGGGEAADLHRPVGVAAQLVLEVLEVDAAVAVLAGSSRGRRPTRARAARWSGARRAR